MSTSLVSGFVLPRTTESAAEEQLHAHLAENQLEDHLAGVQDPSGEIQALQAQVDSEQSFGGQLRSMGMFTSDLASKASEGMSKMVSDFGNSIPFGKAGANAPTFSSVLASVQSAGMAGVSSAVSGALTAAKSAVSGIIGTAFGGSKGLLPDSAINNLVASKDATASAAAIKNSMGGSSGDLVDFSHQVSLTSEVDSRSVFFEVMPEIVENRTVGYEAVAPAQSPGAFQKYKGTESTQWTINAVLISRTSREATDNLLRLNTLRGWTMPYFGERTHEIYPDKIGAPPPVLMLRGLRNSIVGPMPVVITSLSWTWPKDVDYIPAEATDGSASNIPFPVVISVAINLVESLSTKEFNNFNLNDFFKGKMIEAFRNDNTTVPSEISDLDKAIAQEAQTVQRPPVVVDDYKDTRGDLRYPKPPAIVSEAKTATQNLPFVSGKGGDFGGGGATGRF